jgi:hypothetical protein
MQSHLLRPGSGTGSRSGPRLPDSDPDPTKKVRIQLDPTKNVRIQLDPTKKVRIRLDPDPDPQHWSCDTHKPHILKIWFNPYECTV